MFEDSLFETSGAFRTKRRWTTTALSFALQCAGIALLVLVPLIYTEALPKQQIMTFLVAPPPPPPPPPPPAARIKVVKAVQTEVVSGHLRTPAKIPQKVAMIKEEAAPPPMEMGVIGGVQGGVPGGSLEGVMGGIVGSAVPAMPKVAAPAPPQRLKVSAGVQAGNLITQVKPSYPPIARAARVSGAVVLQAEISKSGTIENLRVVSGHPMLVANAIEAVKQWRYKPYLLNNEAVAVETTITVNFTLGS